jgi:hypothetical protein
VDRHPGEPVAGGLREIQDVIPGDPTSARHSLAPGRPVHVLSACARWPRCSPQGNSGHRTSGTLFQGFPASSNEPRRLVRSVPPERKSSVPAGNVVELTSGRAVGDTKTRGRGEGQTGEEVLNSSSKALRAMELTRAYPFCHRSASPCHRVSPSPRLKLKSTVLAPPRPRPMNRKGVTP